MTNIFLTSSVNFVANDIPKYLVKPPQKLQLLFVDTAAEVEKGDKQWLKDDRNSLIKAGFQVFDYTFSGKNKEEIKKRLDEVDILSLNIRNKFDNIIKNLLL